MTECRLPLEQLTGLSLPVQWFDNLNRGFRHGLLT